jgi:integrase
LREHANTALNDTIADLLDDWRMHLRARNRRPLTIQSYLETGRHFAACLAERGMLERSSADAGIPRVHPHQLWHEFAHRWLAAGGQEQDLMRLVGWKIREMVGREAHRRLALGDEL